MQVDVLVQNVSDQCIPNWVAAKTYRPRLIVWVYTIEKEHILQRLKLAMQGTAQESWLVDARDSQSLEKTLTQKFTQLKAKGRVVYHLTGGTKSMSLQGMHALMKQAHLQSEGVVMDPQSQHFDVVLPKAHNNQIACEVLGFNQILSVHGSKRKDKTGRSMQVVLPHYEHIQQLRVLYPQLMRDLKGVEVCAKADAQNNRGLFYLRNNKPLTSAIVQGLSLAQEIGMIKKLKIHQNQFGFEPVHTDNPIAYIRNTWMEDWVAAVLAKHDDGHWNGGFSGIEVSIKQYEDYQEFDFLGARKNHLVYWSCKNTKEVKPEQLFEIDALRDEVGGRDFHIAGLVHTAAVKSGLQMKARRLGLQLINVLDNHAEEKLVEISCR